MSIMQDIYKGSMTLLTDLYQLTMAYGYWKSGMAEKTGVFHLYFRNNPFNGGFTITCGLDHVVHFLDNFHFATNDLNYLASLRSNSGSNLFPAEFLDYLQQLKFSCDVDAIAEGTVVFPHEPLIRVSGPILQGQLIETPLLNIINFQSLIATKAARINLAVQGEPVMEFGLRRAHGIDGALTASRAAYIGGCSSTSNVLAGKLFGIPLSGTHGHSWVMSFKNELESFKAYADAFPDNCIFLVDTYDTMEGVKNAIKAGEILRERGKTLSGIRIDSGDLAWFSIVAREMLDSAGFKETNIIASNDLDENIISSLKSQDAKINLWGVGTKMVTAFDQPSLGAVYKLSAVKNEKWDYKIKLSEQSVKVNNPGIQQVRRFYKNQKMVADMIFDILEPQDINCVIVDPNDSTRRKVLESEKHEVVDLLKPVFINGEKVYDQPEIHKIREIVKLELDRLHQGVKRFVNPHLYPAGLEERLYNIKMDLIHNLKNNKK